MKKIKFLIIVLFVLASPVFSNAQISTGEQFANGIAKAMKDSLTMTSEQYFKIQQINLELLRKNIEAFKRSSNTDTIRIILQQVEDSRDTLYSAILEPNQYELYKKKKRHLIKVWN